MPLTSYDLGRPHNSSRLPHLLERLAELAVACRWDSTRGMEDQPRRADACPHPSTEPGKTGPTPGEVAPKAT